MVQPETLIPLVIAALTGFAAPMLVTLLKGLLAGGAARVADDAEIRHELRGDVKDMRKELDECLQSRLVLQGQVQDLKRRLQVVEERLAAVENLDDALLRRQRQAAESDGAPEEKTA